MRTLTGVRAQFSASHTDPVREELHGHSYEVWAYWPSSPLVDAVELQARLQEHLRSRLDHKTLPAELGRAEDVAQSILVTLACARVRVIRPVEGLEAVAELF